MINNRIKKLEIKGSGNITTYYVGKSSVGVVNVIKAGIKIKEGSNEIKQ